MKTFIFMMLLVSLECASAYAQNEVMESAVRLLGAASEEELDEGEYERFLALSRHPLKLNLCSRSRLLSSGVLSAFQVASLLDYRARYGDVLSVDELALVDGFSSVARWLEPFVDFQSNAPVGRARDSLKVSGDILLRTGMKNANASAAMKLGMDAGDLLTGAFSMKKGYTDPLWPPGSAGWALGYNGRRHLTKLVLGDFNARFGQGLVMWSGFSMSGFSSAAGFAKHPSGLSVSHSFTTPLRGAGMELSFGRFVASSMASMDGKAAGNLTCLGRHGQVGVTAAAAFKGKKRGAAMSVDTRFSYGMVDYFGEMAYGTGGAAALAGATLNPAYGCRISLLGRCYPAGFYAPAPAAARSSSKSSDEVGIALGSDWKSLACTIDYAYHPSSDASQFKTVLNYKLQATDMLACTLRSSFRVRPKDPSPYRTDLRLDVDAAYDAFSSRLRADALHCSGWSWLTYAELGYKERFLSYLRATLFQVDSWDDRIYVYERDMPGTFTSPAYYGRGFAMSLYSGYKMKKVVRHRFTTLGFYLRASAVLYHRTSLSGRADAAELKFQMVSSF
ncbi:MAG: hypothetical protein MJY83_07820 [Bacteroidales bacterium]|nr:hypothetical protein [Bacteroidales bacterium]